MNNHLQHVSVSVKSCKMSSFSLCYGHYICNRTGHCAKVTIFVFSKYDSQFFHEIDTNISFFDEKYFICKTYSIPLKS